MATNPPPTDDEINDMANAVVAGDEAEMNAFVNATIDDLKAMIERRWLRDDRLKGRVDRSDVAQSTYRQFLELCREKESAIRNWRAVLYGTARLCLWNRLREHMAEMRDPTREARGDSVTDALRDGERTPPSAVIHAEDIARLETALAALPDEDRALFLRRALSDDTWEVIAVEIGEPTETVKKRYYRILTRLRAALGEAG